MERLQLLFQKYLDNNISKEEFAEIWKLLETEEQIEKLSPQLQLLWEKHPEYILTDSHWNKKFAEYKLAKQVIDIKHINFWKYVIAASIFICMSGIGYLFFNLNKADKSIKNEISFKSKLDIESGRNGAILKFDNGNTIILDSAKNGQLTSSVSKIDGTVTVKGISIEYATLTTPRARQQQITLSDGSKVWLNAASSIRFPTVFKGKERIIEVTGEAYFEIAKDLNKPFIVKINDAAIEVLGTHFNVMAYSNESSLNTTLLEGSIKFKHNNKVVLLSPGQQSQLMKNGEQKLLNAVDLSEVIAWKNGMQSFNNADIQTIMRQVERWYDVDVSYEGVISKRTFSGEIPRTANLSELLKLFEVNKIHFRINSEEKTLVVLP